MLRMRVPLQRAIGVVVSVVPIFHVVGPGLANRAGLVPAVVVDELVFLVVGVKKPGGRQLLEVVHAADALGLRRRFTQCGQQQTGEDGDNGDDHQELDECESGLRHEIDGISLNHSRSLRQS